jgi:Flp pilus assembly protein TadG
VAAVEFAIIAVVLFTLVFGMIQFGLWLSKYQAMTAAAREGARVAALRRDEAAVRAAITQAAAPYTWDQSTFSWDGPCTDAKAQAGALVTVRWTQSFRDLRLLSWLPLIPTSREIKGVFRCE